MAMIGKADVARWRADPIAFLTGVLIDPETGQRFELYEAQEIFLSRALTLNAAGRLPFPELVYSCPKKSGKTATAAQLDRHRRKFLAIAAGAAGVRQAG
jgi:hypothetical protein